MVAFLLNSYKILLKMLICSIFPTYSVILSIVGCETIRITKESVEI